jgi:putative transposase
MEIIAKDRLNAEAVRQLAERLRREQRSLEGAGYKITTNMVLKAAVEKRSIEAVCADLTDVVDGNTLREALNQALSVEDLRCHEAEFNAALEKCIPDQMPRRGWERGIDVHDAPFYGKTEALQASTCRGEAREGTTYFWRIASLYVIWRQVRLMLALTYVFSKESILSLVQRLLARREVLGFSFKGLYLDKGFCNGQVIAYLQSGHLSAVSACPTRGEAGKGGTCALCQGRKHSRTRYTFTDGTTADLAVVPTLTRHKKTGKRRREGLVYVLIHLDWSAKKAQQRYSRRFGIESSYRQLGQVRAFTNSRNSALRFFYLALAVLLLNIWTFLRCVCTRLIATGPFRLDLTLFRLARFSAFLRRAAEQAYATTLSIPIYSW